MTTMHDLAAIVLDRPLTRDDAMYLAPAEIYRRAIQALLEERERRQRAEEIIAALQKILDEIRGA